MIIERQEIKKLKEIDKWVLVYGRRKTGKTFMVKNFIEYDEFFFVKRDRTIISEKDGKQITYDTFTSILERTLNENKTAVVDEFHRLGDEFLDFLQYTRKKGKLILISSTLYMSKKLFESKSPILGFFAEFPVGLISLNDTLMALQKDNLGNKDLLELGILLREPIAIDFYRRGKEVRKTISLITVSSIKTIPALTGEIFTEEERELSAVYEGVLRGIASRRYTSTEISNYLFSRKLIKKDDPSLIQQYLSNLVDFGLIRRIRIYGRNKFIYKHVSPLASIFYYADEKYNISERTPSEGEIRRLVDELMPRIVEDNVRETLSEKYSLRESIFETKDFDVDVCLLKFKKPEIAVEVKWGEKINLEKIKENLSKVEARRSMLFVPNKSKLTGKGIEVIDVSNLI